jgi:hypothetical protein
VRVYVDVSSQVAPDK